MPLFLKPILTTFLATALSTSALAGSPPPNPAANNSRANAWLWALATDEYLTNLAEFGKRAELIPMGRLMEPRNQFITPAAEAQEKLFILQNLRSRNELFKKTKFWWQSEQGSLGRLARINISNVSGTVCVKVDDFKLVPNAAARKWDGTLFREEPWAYEGFAIETINPKPVPNKWPKLIVWVKTGESCIDVAAITRFEKDSAK